CAVFLRQTDTHRSDDQSVTQLHSADEAGCQQLGLSRSAAHPIAHRRFPLSDGVLWLAALGCDVSTIDDDLGGGQVARLARQEKTHPAADLFGTADATELDTTRKMFAGYHLESRFHNGRIDDTRGDCIDADVMVPELIGHGS